MTATLPNPWTRGAVKGKPAEDGSVRVWSAEDAERLARDGIIQVGKSTIRLPVRGAARITGSCCPGCQQEKRIAKNGGPFPLWCFGCGVWSAESAAAPGRVA